MNFKELSLPDFIIKAIEKLGFDKMTEIQEKTIPIIREGKNIIGKSKTGSGKTFAFGVPAIEKVNIESKNTQILIIAPTRELAGQICDELRKITTFKEGCRIVPIFGGSDMSRQIKAIKAGAKIVVGTPGRVLDHIRRRSLRLNTLKMLILDEADEMLDMGFRDDIESIINATNDDKQFIMFSATMPKEVIDLSRKYVSDATFVEITGKDSLIDVKEKYVYVNSRNKMNTLIDILNDSKPNLSIIFTNMKKNVDEIVDKLSETGFNVFGLHGDMRQGARRKVMQEIKTISTGVNNGKINILVATDVAARGIDISGVDIVINYDVPNDYDYYTHRIGRTGRANKSGIAISIVGTPNQLTNLMAISKERKIQIEKMVLAGSKPVNEDLFDEKIKHSSKSKRTYKRDAQTTRHTNSGRNDKKYGYEKFDRKTDSSRYGRKSERNAEGSKYSKRTDRNSEDSKYGKRTNKSNNSRFSKTDDTNKEIKHTRYTKTDNYNKDNKNSRYAKNDNNRGRMSKDNARFGDDLKKVDGHSGYNKSYRGKSNNNNKSNKLFDKEKTKKDSYNKDKKRNNTRDDKYSNRSDGKKNYFEKKSNNRKVSDDFKDKIRPRKDTHKM